MSNQQPKLNITLDVFRCAQCSDSFPAEVGTGPVICPSCGGTSAEPASEPLL